MPLLPEVLGRRAEGEALVLEIRAAPELDFFAGHFPGQPVLPGVMQVHWAIHFARQEGWARGAFQAIEQLKFNALIHPGQVLQMRLAWDGTLLHFSLERGEERCASGRVRFGGAA